MSNSKLEAMNWAKHVLLLITRPTVFFKNFPKKPSVWKTFFLIITPLMMMNLIQAPLITALLKEQLLKTDLHTSNHLLHLFTVLSIGIQTLQGVLSVLVGGIVVHIVSHILGGVATFKNTLAFYFFTCIPYTFKSITLCAFYLAGYNTIGLSHSTLITLTDPFFIWSLILLVFGLKFVHQLNWSKSIAVSFSFWVIQFISTQISTQLL